MNEVRFRRRQVGRLVRVSFERDERVRLVAVTLVLAILSALVLLISPPRAAGYEVGEVADRAVRAPRSLTYPSEILTAEARDRAAEQVATVYRRDPGVAAQQTAALEQALVRIRQVREDSAPPRTERLATLEQVGLEGEAAAAALDMSDEEWTAVERELPPLLRNLLAQEVRPADLAQVRADAPQALPPPWSARQKLVGGELLTAMVVPNSTVDPEATERARREAREGVLPVFVSIVAGEVIVRDGAVVTPQDAEKLRALGFVAPGVDLDVTLGLMLWVLLVAVMFTLYMQRYQPEVWADTRRMAVAIGVLVLTVAVSRSVITDDSILPYFIPFAAIAMTLSVLLGGRTALVAQTAVALHVGVMSGQVELVAYVLLPALIGMSVLRRGASAPEFLLATVFVAAGNLAVIGASLLLRQGADTIPLAQLIAAAIANAVASGFFAFAGIIFLGHLARIPTTFELRELADPNHPLLRQLLLRTPGTYHHSLLVANLAERAAEVIGADPLVARVGAYYHDIGKMRNPSAFIENQAGEANPHDELDPLVSAQIVAAHVRDGLALADRYRLPGVIREMIPAHHGTSVVKFFYQQAQAKGETPDPEAYRYPGPRPRSREAGIVMLADGVEASVRSLPAKTLEEIGRMVDKIVSERVAEGQLDECDMTMSDVQRIKTAFSELLAGVYHERIPYPEDRITRIPPARGAAQS